MRILHLIPSMGGGGAERQLTYLCPELVRSGCEVHVALIYGGPNMDRMELSGAVIHRLKCRSNYDPLLIYRIARLINRIRPDIIQTWLPQMDVLGGIAAVLTGIPFVMAERSSGLAYYRGWKDRLRCFVSSRAALIIPNSYGGRDYWLSMGRRQNNLAVVRNAIPFDEIDKITSSPKEMVIPSNAEAIVFAGRYIDIKNLPVMLEAIRLAIELRPRVIAYLFGDGPMKDILSDFNMRNNLAERIIINGYTPYLWSIMKSASVFVNISTYEGNPNTVLEAIACCCPVVVSDIPAHWEFLNDESAWFVPTGSHDGIAAGIIAALTNKDEARRRVERARHAIAHWSPSEVAAEYLKLYENVLSGTRT